MDKIKELKILATIRKLILEEGVENANLDRVSIELRISKKTIYKYYDSKSDILSILLKRFINKNINFFERKISHLEPKQRLTRLFYLSNDIYTLIDDNILKFISNYVPNGKDELSAFENNFLVSSFETAISDGVSLHYFRREVDTRILAILALQLSKLSCRNPDFKKNKLALPQMIDYFIAGLIK
ncbi:hypothetical protein GCM10009122_42060 [Fulvivirga kasyanovii]|uniref:TetR/AcrR family transcriptional regulator n=1 Tax=Fulvivirga kasyanovii TaxID=396812 RepID=UPI0031D3470D